MKTRFCVSAPNGRDRRELILHVAEIGGLSFMHGPGGSLFGFHTRPSQLSNQAVKLQTLQLKNIEL